MRKVIAAINTTLDGYCDHTAIDPDEDIHQHYADLLRQSSLVLYGRITYELMEYWPKILKEPTGVKATDEFASVMDHIPKLVFSHTLKSVDWHSARLADRGLEETVRELKQQDGGDILVGSRSLIMALMKLNLVDEFQLCVHPVIAGRGLLLFEKLHDRMLLKRVGIKTFSSGAVILCYEPGEISMTLK